MATVMKTNRVIVLAGVGIAMLAIVLLVTVLMPINCHKGPRFAFFLYDGTDTFIAEMMTYMIAALPEDVTYEIFDAGNSQSVQNRQIVAQIDNGFDIFIINAVDRLAGSSIVERLTREGLPIIFFNREPLQDALIGRENVFYVGAAADSLGVQQAEIAARFFRDRGISSIRLITLMGEHGHQDAEKRTEHSVSRLRELGFDVDILATRSANWRRLDAYEAMRSLFAQFGEEIDLVFANNDDMALGAIDFLLGSGVFVEESKPEEKPFIIVSVDGTPVGLDAVRRGLVYGTVHNDIPGQTGAILTLAQYIVNGRDLSSFPYEIVSGHFIYIDGGIITRENLIESVEH